MIEKPRLVHFALLLPLLAVAIWVGLRARDTRDDPAAVLAALKASQGPALPSAEDAGAVSRGELLHFDPDTLYEYIDGAAEAYLARGFRSCVVATYTFAGDGAEADAEIYRFADADGARAQLEAERPAGAAPVAGVEDAWADGDVLLACAGTDYLKVTAFGPPGTMATDLEALAAAWRRGVQP